MPQKENSQRDVISSRTEYEFRKSPPTQRRQSMSTDREGEKKTIRDENNERINENTKMHLARNCCTPRARGGGEGHAA